MFVEVWFITGCGGAEGQAAVRHFGASLESAIELCSSLSCQGSVEWIESVAITDADSGYIFQSKWIQMRGVMKQDIVHTSYVAI